MLKHLATASLLVAIMGLVIFVLALFGRIDLKIGGAGLLVFVVLGLAGGLNLPEKN